MYRDGKIVLNVCNFFDNPIESHKIDINCIDLNSQSSLKSIHINDVKYKCFFVEIDREKAYIATLSHNVLH